ncbi:MAG: porin [Nitrospinae bacterium]|nr:porin [Nitrospinota bacterium]
MGIVMSKLFRKACTYLFAIALIFGFMALQGTGNLASAEDGENSIAKKLGLSLYGYVDASYTQNFNNPSPSAGGNALRIFDVDSNSFRPHMAQIVLEREGKTGGSMEDRGGFRIKLNYGEDAQLTGGSIIGNVPSAGAGGGTDFDSGDDFDFQEAYVQYIAPIGNGLDLRIGRMNTLIGYEVIESPNNPNFSRSWLFGFGEPFTTTGVRASYEFNDMVSFSIGVINDFTGTQSDTNNSKSVESLVSIAPMDNVGIYLFGFWGAEGAIGADDSDRVQVGGIVDVQLTDQAEVVVEGYYGNFANAPGLDPGVNARWDGVAGYLIYDFTDKWGARFRSEVFKDATGFFTGTAQTLWEVTSTLQYKPIPSIITRAEFRYDKSDETPFFVGTRAANHQETLGFEVIYLF